MARPKRPEIKIGDHVIIRGKRAISGQDGHVAEIDQGKKRVRLAEFGWLPRAEVEILDSPASEKPTEVKTLVDGAESKVVFDGKSGQPVEDAMVKPPLEDLVRSLTRAKEALGNATIIKKRAGDNFKDAQGAVNAIVEELVVHYGNAAQLHLDLHPHPEASAEIPEDEEEEEEEDEQLERETVGAAAGGVRDYSGKGDGPE